MKAYMYDWAHFWKEDWPKPYFTCMDKLTTQNPALFSQHNPTLQYFMVVVSNMSSMMNPNEKLNMQ